jgi:CubicO group peptidase (beta-lactamase class C family)
MNQVVFSLRAKFLFLFIAVPMAFCPLKVANGQSEAFAKKAKEVLAKVASDKTSAVAVLVARDGKIEFQGAAGQADLEKKIPATVDTKFRIGSITKQFTAAAILKLAEEGKLKINDPLAKYFPDFTKNKEITLEHLLTHTSGLFGYTEKADFYSRVTQPVKPQELIDWAKNDELEFAPGTEFRYCNTGYFLLGEIVAKVSGKSYADYLNATFFKPLGMKNTGIYDNASPPTNMANGYSLKDEKYEPALNWDMSWAGGAGAMYSTVGDLFIWNEALHGGKVINADSLKAATTVYKLPKSATASMSYGYGLCSTTHRRLPVICHSGGLQGWMADLLYFPQQKTTVAVLTNAMPGAPELNPQMIARTSAEKFLAEAIAKLPPRQVDKSVDPKLYADYVGRYDYVSAVMDVTTEGGKLFAQLTGQQKLELLPESKDHFFWKEVDAEIIFQRNEQGKVTSGIHTQAGNSFGVAKVAEDEKVDAADLKAFVGQYQYGPAVMTTTVENGQLFAQLTDQPKFPIYPKGKNTFEWRVVKAQVEFIKDKEGAVTAARHTQNGATFDAPKKK